MVLKDYRLFLIEYPIQKKNEATKLFDLIKSSKNINDSRIRNLRIRKQKNLANQNKIKLKLYGYDEEMKYSPHTPDKITQASVNNLMRRVYRRIDNMPMGQQEKKIRGTLYNDSNPQTTLKGTGFKNVKKARQTIQLVRDKPKIYQFQVINTMYYRAKHHPYRTRDMEEAMKVLKQWLDSYKKSF